MPSKFADEDDRSGQRAQEGASPESGADPAAQEPTSADPAAQEPTSADPTSPSSQSEGSQQAPDNALRQAQDNALRQAQDNALRQAQDNALRQAQDTARWVEPAVASQRIFRDLFAAGGKTEQELEHLLATYTTTMGWADYWAREGFLTEVVSGSQKRIALSRKAVLELELA